MLHKIARIADANARQYDIRQYDNQSSKEENMVRVKSVVTLLKK